MSRVSVIIPMYNVQEYIKECLKSILDQDYDDIEVICIDDGSTDKTVQSVEYLMSDDNRISLIKCQHYNAGRARNEGIRRASGQYYYFMDADDILLDNMLNECVTKLEEDFADVVIFGANKFDSDTSLAEYMPKSLRTDRIPRDIPFNGEGMPEYIFNSFKNWAWNKMFRADFVKNNDIWFQEISRTNDMLFVSKALALATRITIIDKPFIDYRKGRDSNLQSTNDKDPLAFWHAYTETKHMLENIGKYEIFKRSLLNTILSGTVYNIDSMNDKKAKRYVRDTVFEGLEYEFGLDKCEKEYFFEEKAFKRFQELSNNARPVRKGDHKKQLEKCVKLEEENLILKNKIDELEKENNILNCRVVELKTKNENG